MAGVREGGRKREVILCLLSDIHKWVWKGLVTPTIHTNHKGGLLWGLVYMHRIVEFQKVSRKGGEAKGRYQLKYVLGAECFVLN